MHPQFLRMIMSHAGAQALESVGAATREAPATSASTLIGTTLEGAYRITRLIAEGGMSAVYEAVQLRLHQRVAVKVMARELARNQEALARFQREADITSRLRHPHLVTVMDFGTAPTGQPYLVMEYLDGIDLEHRIRKEDRLSLPTALHITKQVAAALGAAHEQGVVHRDLKPANVFLVELPGEPDFAKILDFGISKVRAASTQLTKAESIIGTPNYMSPEQAAGLLEEVDHRSDQWALACMVWEMLAGRAPFASDDMSAVFYQVIHLDPRPLRERAPDVPLAVEAVLRRALSKSVTARYSSTRDFADALATSACEPAAAVVPQARMPQEPLGEVSPPEGVVWVERRQARRERRRLDASGRLAPVIGQTGGDEPDAAINTRLWRKVNPIHALAAAALVVMALALLRENQPAKASVPPVAATATAATAAPSIVVEAPAPIPPPPAAPAPAKPRGRSAKQKTGSRVMLARDASDPFESDRRPGKPRPAKAGRGHDDADDSIDPFAPTRLTRTHKPPRAGRPDGDLADPFAP
jgi:serine/threonine protein kinase